MVCRWPVVPFEGAKKLLPGKRPFVLTRAGYCGIQRYAAAWTGDNVSTDEHMLAGTRLINSLGLTGVFFFRKRCRWFCRRS